MIKLKDITVIETEHPRFIEFKARPSVTSGLRLDIEEKEHKQDAINHLKHQLWRHIYGDLLEPMRELMHEALYSTRDPHVKELCDRLNELLQPDEAVTAETR